MNTSRTSARGAARPLYPSPGRAARLTASGATVLLAGGCVVTGLSDRAALTASSDALATVASECAPPLAEALGATVTGTKVTALDRRDGNPKIDSVTFAVAVAVDMDGGRVSHTAMADAMPVGCLTALDTPRDNNGGREIVAEGTRDEGAILLSLLYDEDAVSGTTGFPVWELRIENASRAEATRDDYEAWNDTAVRLP